jgi:hypothetical protein
MLLQVKIGRRFSEGEAGLGGLSVFLRLAFKCSRNLASVVKSTYDSSVASQQTRKQRNATTHACPRCSLFIFSWLCPFFNIDTDDIVALHTSILFSSSPFPTVHLAASRNRRRVQSGLWREHIETRLCRSDCANNSSLVTFQPRAAGSCITTQPRRHCSLPDC